MVDGPFRDVDQSRCIFLLGGVVWLPLCLFFVGGGSLSGGDDSGGEII